MERTNNPTPPRQRGRKSSASFAIVSDVLLRDPEPPTDLTPTERKIWDGIVEQIRPGWFRASEALLASYCRLAAQEAELAGLLEETEQGSPRHFEVLRLMVSVAMSAANLAGKLRLTPRSSVDRYTPKLASSGPGPRPWEDGALSEQPEPPAA